MITLEQIAGVLKNHPKEDGITEVEVSPDGFVFSELASRIDPDQPYALVVKPIEKRLILRLLVPGIMRIGKDSKIFRTLAQLNLGLVYGSLGINDKGEIAFKYHHFCKDSPAEPSPDIIKRLLSKYIRDLRRIEGILLREAVIEAGVPCKRAGRIVKTLLLDSQESETGN